MRPVFVGLLGLLLQAGAGGQQAGDLREMPELHVVKEATLAPSYSCRSADEFARGYQATALFLATASKARNSPDLLFNGACGSQDVFMASTAGDDMALVADLGAGVSLESLTAQNAFNLKGVAAPGNYTQFAMMAPVVSGHTYVVLLNKDRVRGLLAFRVTAHEPNRSVTIRYSVKSYAVLRVERSAGRFDGAAPGRVAAAAEPPR